METTIGQSLKRSRASVAIACAAGAAVIVVDMWLAGTGASDVARPLLAATGLVAYGVLARWQRHSLGWTVTPRQGWLYWLKATLILGGIVLAVVLAAVGTAAVAGIEAEVHRLFRQPSDFWPWALHACLVAPILEEAIYRFVLCVPAAAVARPWLAIVLSGIVFAALHVVYGNPSPDNAVAGFLLAWAYLKSGSLLVPVGLHALGNLCVGLLHVGACYWTP